MFLVKQTGEVNNIHIPLRMITEAMKTPPRPIFALHFMSRLPGIDPWALIYVHQHRVDLDNYGMYSTLG